MRNITRAGLLLVLVTVPIPTKADDRANERITIIGVGSRSCGQYLQAAKGEKNVRPPDANPDAAYSSHYGEYVDFTDGFLSGANFADVTPGRMVGHGSDHAGRMAWLENDCRANPVMAFVGALFKLREYLAEQGR
jgi:hypothetical protein